MAARMGRPPKYTKTIHAAIVKSLEAGASRTTAAELAGIHRNTLADWCETYPAFSSDVTKAIAQAKAKASITVANAIQNGDVNAAFRYLSYQEPEEWSAPERHEITGDNGGPLVIQFTERKDGPA